ncbi:MAG TPA: PCRF domain-containing protein, partial [Dissulfurispiraceae bacterium]
MLDKLLVIEEKYNEIMDALMKPEVLSNAQEYQKRSKERADLQPIVEKIVEYKKLLGDIEGAEELIKSGDGDLRELAQEELEELKGRRPGLEDELKIMLLPKDPRDERNVILEIRAGTGGEEAALFGASLFRMYSKYAESKRWKIEVIDSSPTGLGGLKEIIANITGKGAYSKL